MSFFKNIRERRCRMRALRHGWGPHRHGRFGRSGRILGHGELRFLLLALIGEKPRHGYDLIKAIEEKVAGAYSPSPGVIYPTLTLLEDMGWVSASSDAEAKKLFTVTQDGTLALAANKALVDDMMARLAQVKDGVAQANDGEDEDAHWSDPRTFRGFAKVPVMRGFKQLRRAMRARLMAAPLSEEQLKRVAAILEETAKKISEV